MIKPFGHAVTVADPPETDTPKRQLYVVGNQPVEYDRGVVMEIADGCPALECLSRGDMLYHMKGSAAEIDDVKVVHTQNIIAYDSVSS